MYIHTDRTSQKHEKLAELKKEYEHKMKVINEIKREKELRELKEKDLAKQEHALRANELKVKTEQFKIAKEKEEKKARQLMEE